MRVLHVLDATTPPDAIELLATLLRQEAQSAELAQHVTILGHHSTKDLASAAGFDTLLPPASRLRVIPSMGWADPSGWRGLKREIRAFRPTHVNAWGIPAAFATMMTGFGATSSDGRTAAEGQGGGDAEAGGRIVSLMELPKQNLLRLLRPIHYGCLTAKKRLSACHWVTGSAWLRRELAALGVPSDCATHIRPVFDAHTTSDAAANALRTQLGLIPRNGDNIIPPDGPILLLGGEGDANDLLVNPSFASLSSLTGGARHDLGLWTAAILRQIFPRIRAIIRENPRANSSGPGGGNAGLERLVDHLPEEDIVLIAPAERSWNELLSISDLLLVTPELPFGAGGGGAILRAMAAGVPVVGTPMESVREWLHRSGPSESTVENGLLAASAKPRAIAAAVEQLLSDPSLRQCVTRRALQDAAPYSVNAMRQAYREIYETIQQTAIF